VAAQSPGASCKFAKTGGTIYGYNDAVPNDPYNNKVVDASLNVRNGYGHGIFIHGTLYSKQTTVGPEHQLFFRYPTYDDTSGWF
jgi:hypothetical protein